MYATAARSVASAATANPAGFSDAWRVTPSGGFSVWQLRTSKLKAARA